MGLFGGIKSYLGIDIGKASIKIVELVKKEGKPTLLTYGYAEEETEIIKSDLKETKERIAFLIKEICQKAKTKSKKAISALPNFSVFNSVLSLPLMSRKDLANAVKWEAKKFVPIPIEDVVLDYKVLEEDKAKKILRVLMTAAPKTLVKKYVEIFKLTGLELLSLETESFSLVRSLVGKDPSIIMLLDFGAITCDIIIVEKSIPILTRSIDVGGKTISQAIANTLGIDLKRAEQFKRDVGIGREAAGIPRVIESTLAPVINEIRYSLDLYQSQVSKKIEKIVLSGGSAFLPNLSNYLEEKFSIKCYIGDPWARISYPPELKPVLEELGPRFSVAIGLALRELE